MTSVLIYNALFFDKSVAERVKEIFRDHGSVVAGSAPLVCVLDHLAVGVQFDDDGGRTDVFALLDGLVGRQERFVLYKLEAARMVDQGITSNACLRVVGFGEAAVDDKQFPVCLDRVLAFDGAYGDMSVDDVAVLAGDAELVQQHVTDRFFFPEGIVGAVFPPSAPICRR